MKYSNESTLDFKTIVLEHIKKILEISSEELRNKTVTHMSPNMEQTETKEDTRKSYIQSIENLAYVLMPYFDDDIKTCYDDAIKIINGQTFEIKKELSEEYKKLKEQYKNDARNFTEGFIRLVKMRSAKKLFIGLNCLLNRNNYLKSSVYGDVAGSDEVVEDEEEKTE